MDKSKLLLSSAVALWLLSLCIFLLLVSELTLELYEGTRYATVNPGAVGGVTPFTYKWHGNTVILSDKYENGDSTGEDTETGIVTTAVNGHYYTLQQPVSISVTASAEERYYHVISVIVLTDKLERWQRMIVLQSYPDYNLNPEYLIQYRDLRCRALWVAPNGTVTDENFRFGDYINDPLRSILATEVSPIFFGTFSFMPTWDLFYPIFFPGLSLILTSVSLSKYYKRHRR